MQKHIKYTDFPLLCGHVYGNCEYGVMDLSATNMVDGSWEIHRAARNHQIMLITAGCASTKLNVLCQVLSKCSQ